MNDANTIRDALPMSWFDRIALAVQAWERWAELPINPRMDRVFKESGVRDLVAALDRLEAQSKEIPMGAIPATQTKITTDEKLNRIAATLALLATEMDMRDDEYATAYGQPRIPETGPRMSIEEQVERTLYPEHFTWTAVPKGGLW